MTRDAGKNNKRRSRQNSHQNTSALKDQPLIPNEFKTLLFIGACVLIGAGIRFQGLGARDFWFDESCTFIYVHNLFDWQSGRSLLVESTNLPYYAALRAWIAVFGESEAAYRAMSALASTLSIPLLAFAALRLGGGLCGMITAALLAFHPLHIHYAHEARAYALWFLLLSICLVFLIEAVRFNRAKFWIGYASGLLVTIVTHYYTVFWIPATAVVPILLGARKRKAFNRWLIATFIVGLIFAPYFFAAVSPAAQGGATAWIAESWSPGRALFMSLWAFMPAGVYPAHLRGLSEFSPDTVVLGPAWLRALVNFVPTAIVLGCVLLIILFRKREDCVLSVNGEHQITWRSAHIVAASLTLIPLLLAWSYSVLVKPIYFVGRYDLVALPGFVIWIGLIVAQVSELLVCGRTGPKNDQSRDRKGAVLHVIQPHANRLESNDAPCSDEIRLRNKNNIAAVIVAPMILCSILPIVRMAALRPPPTIHHARADWLARTCQPKDLVIAFSYDRAAMLYYLNRAGFKGAILGFPSWLDDQIGWLDTDADLDSSRDQLLREDAEQLLQIMETTTTHDGRVFLVLDSMDPAGHGNRGPIQKIFSESVHSRDYVSEPLDEQLLIVELVRTDS